MRGRIPTAFVLLLLAGCTQQPPESVQTEAGDDGPVEPWGASAPIESTSQETRQEILYTFDDVVAGGSAPSDVAPNPGLPIAHVATFAVPNGTITLEFTAERVPTAMTGAARVEVLGPEGELVYRSDTWSGAGGGGLWAGMTDATASNSFKGVAGQHTVNYHVAGAFSLFVQVTATLPTGIRS